MRIKSKDIHFVQPIFYLANKKKIDISLFFLRYYSNRQKSLNCLVYFFAFKIERACKYPTCKLMTT